MSYYTTYTYNTNRISEGHIILHTLVQTEYLMVILYYIHLYTEYLMAIEHLVQDLSYYTTYTCTHGIQTEYMNRSWLLLHTLVQTDVQLYYIHLMVILYYIHLYKQDI